MCRISVFLFTLGIWCECLVLISGIPEIFVKDQHSSNPLQIVSKGNSIFATDLYQVITKIEPGNFAISPFSLSNILAMLRAGTGGDTAKDIQNGLRLGSLNESQLYDGFSQLLESFKNNPYVTIEMANSVYVEKSYEIRDEYLDLLRSKFFAGAEALDFSDGEGVAEKINTFVKDVTRNTIADLISSSTITKDTKAILVNAIFFKGLWKDAFSVNRTESAPFYTNADKSIQVEMMRQEMEYPYAKIPDLNATAAMLPYIGERFSLVVVLPNERTGLRYVESKLSEFQLSAIPAKLKPTLLNLSLPKFNLSSTMDFVRNKALENIGMSTALSRLADYSGISKGNGIYLSQILQKAVIEVNEEGTKAAVASAAILVNRVAYLGVSFVVNHPFIGFIYDSQTETILFVFKKTD